MIKIRIILIFFLVQIVFPQEKRKLSTTNDWEFKYISTKEMLEYNTSLELDTIYISKLDSIETCFWKDRYWFFFDLIDEKVSDSEFDMGFFVYNKNQKYLKQATKRKFYLFARWSNIHVFNGQLFLDARLTETDHVYDYSILLIDDKNECEGKYIKVLESALHPLDMYIQSDSLYILLQPHRSEFNYFWLLGFWLPRERGDKWNPIEVGNPLLYVFDKNFNLARKEEVVKKKEQK